MSTPRSAISQLDRDRHGMMNYLAFCQVIGHLSTNGLTVGYFNSSAVKSSMQLLQVHFVK